MFNNCGPKIKTLALVLFIVSLAGSLIAGIALMDVDEAAGICIMVFGTLFSYISSLLMATFGEIAENTATIANAQHQMQAPVAPAAPAAAPQQPAAPVCPNCGKPYTAGSKFCMGCGTPL